jgi:hypothetical protein
MDRRDQRRRDHRDVPTMRDRFRHRSCVRTPRQGRLFGAMRGATGSRRSQSGGSSRGLTMGFRRLAHPGRWI